MAGALMDGTVLFVSLLLVVHSINPVIAFRFTHQNIQILIAQILAGLPWREGGDR